MWDTGPDTLMAEMRFAADPGAVIRGLAWVAADGSTRSRVETTTKAGKLDSLLIADERRTA